MDQVRVKHMAVKMNKTITDFPVLKSKIMVRFLGIA